MIHLIIADDDIKVRRGLTQLIQWEAMDVKVVQVAKNGKEVAEHLHNLDVDVVISDIRMPVMDGLELARYIKENSLDVKLILLSGYAEFEYAQEAMKQGVKHYILKPLNREKLDMLAQMVADIISEKEIRTRLSKKIHSSSFRNEILEILRNENQESVTALMELDPESKKNPSDAVREYYLFLLTVLHEFASEIDAAEIFPQTYTEELMKLTGVDSYINYTKNLFLAVMSFYGKRHGANVVSNVKSFIEISYEKENLATASISEHFGLSASYLSTLFKKETGFSITQYITDCRMGKAAELLAGTSLPIHVVARKIGYPNIPYFYRVFKNYYGVSPAVYRAEGGRVE